MFKRFILVKNWCCVDVSPRVGFKFVTQIESETDNYNSIGVP